LDDHIASPFESIEGTHEYFRLLSETLSEAKRDIEADIAHERESQFPRRLEALRLVLFKLEKLEQNIKSSGRQLNDLRTLRRLLFQERLEPQSKAR
jgi:hypothetical protein